MVYLGNLYFFFKKEKTRDINSILVIVPLALGDVLMATPAIRALRKKFPDVKIDCLCHEYGRVVLDNNPYIDDIIVNNTIYEGNLIGAGFWKKYNFLKLRREAKKYSGYDCVVVFSLFTLPIFSYFTGVPIRVGYEKDNEGFALTRKAEYRYDRHVIESNLAVVDLLGAEGDSEMDLFLDRKYEKFSENIFGKIKGKVIGIGPGGAINPGGRIYSRRWPRDKYSELVKRLVNNKVMLFGSKGDKEVTDYILDSVKSKNVIDFTGKTSLKEAAALIGRCDVFVTNDCGLMHVSAAMGTPTVSIFGSTIPIMKAPLGSKHKYLWKELECAPCYESRNMEECDKANYYRCMESISVEEVENTLHKLLKIR